jgi:hypothetical protein
MHLLLLLWMHLFVGSRSLLSRCRIDKGISMRSQAVDAALIDGGVAGVPGGSNSPAIRQA